MTGYNCSVASTELCIWKRQIPAPTPATGTAPKRRRYWRCGRHATGVSPARSANLGLPLKSRMPSIIRTSQISSALPRIHLASPSERFGIGNFPAKRSGSWAIRIDTWTQFAPTSDGQMQTSSHARRLVPPQCRPGSSGPYSRRVLPQNGYIKSLKQLVHFYNTRGRCRI